jgi:CheY-like chemotaxis protein/Tfp pilus assembly protein PilZ
MENPKLLIVDDAKLFLEIQKMFLESSEVAIRTAMDGLQALSEVQKQIPDLIILDHYMPRMDGAKCCEILKQHDKYRHIPIVMVTLSSHAEDLELFRNAGCDDILIKPLQAGTYLEMIHKYIPSIERRRKRIRLGTPVNFRVNNKIYSGNIKNISMGGMFIETDQAFKTEETLEVCFNLPLEKVVTCRAKGQVAHTSVADNERSVTGIGISLTEIFGEDDCRKKLLDYIKKN